MDTIDVALLALVQGLTEFLPISSSAHLILAPRLFGFADQGLAFDVAVHFGSLGAVLLYFRSEVSRLTGAWFRSLPAGQARTADSALAWAVLIATLPVVVAGLLLQSLIEGELRSALVIALATIGFGLLLWWFDVKGRRQRDEYSLDWRQALFIGGMQVLALIPGTSRSGITMTAGLMLGLTREAAARFSFLLAIPTIAMSAGLITLELVAADHAVDWTALSSGLVLSFVAAYGCIALFLRLIERIGMLPFVLYRLLLGGVILAVLYL